jgi:hypothetical protein
MGSFGWRGVRLVDWEIALLIFLKSRSGKRADGGCMRELFTDWRLWTSVGFVSDWFFDGGGERIIWLGRGPT